MGFGELGFGETGRHHLRGPKKTWQCCSASSHHMEKKEAGQRGSISRENNTKIRLYNTQNNYAIILQGLASLYHGTNAVAISYFSPVTGLFRNYVTVRTCGKILKRNVINIHLRTQKTKWRLADVAVFNDALNVHMGLCHE